MVEPSHPRCDPRVVCVLGEIALSRVHQRVPGDAVLVHEVAEVLSAAIQAAYHAGHYHGQNGEPIPSALLSDLVDLFCQAGQSGPER